MRGGQVIMRALGEMTRAPFSPAATMRAALPKASPMTRVKILGSIQRKVSMMA